MSRLGTSDTALARRARYGDRGAARRLAARHLDRITLLAAVVSADTEHSVVLAQQGFALALNGGRPFEDALVTAFGRLAVSGPDGEAARTRLSLLLLEVEKRPSAEVARLLGLAPVQLTGLAGGAHLSPTARLCRGWPLASRRPGLTEAEHQAGVGHLALCRRCRERLAAVERTRAQLVGGSAGVVGAVAAAQLAPWSGAGTLLTGKAAAGLVGVVGAAVLATGGTAVVVDRTQPHAPAARPAPAASTPALTTPPPRVLTPTPSPGPTGSAVPLPNDLPTTLPATVPTQPALPLPLPTLPVPLPTLPSLPLPDPLPSVLASLLDLP